MQVPMLAQGIDSIRRVIQQQLEDTNLTVAYRDLSYQLYKEKGDSALHLAYEGLKLSRKINDLYGEAANNEMIAIIMSDIGDYVKSLEFHYQSLKLQEKRQSLKGMASAYNNIGIVYMNMKDYDQALRSYRTADSLNKIWKDPNLRYSLTLNQGDILERMQLPDSAFLYYNESLNQAHILKNDYFVGLSLLGLANIYRTKKQPVLAKPLYGEAISLLRYSGDNEQLCDALLGLGKSFEQVGIIDSAFHFSRMALMIANQYSFSNKALDINQYLGEQFAKMGRYDSAYVYQEKTRILHDSLLSNDKLRLGQQLKFNEQIRQQNLLEEKIREAKEHRQHLQYMIIAIFILALFLLTMFLSRIKLHLSVIKFLGVVSLLFFFEFLTLLLHPRVQELTHHTPVLEIIIFVLIASILIPVHHKVEHWVIEKLIHRKNDQQKKIVTK